MRSVCDLELDNVGIVDGGKFAFVFVLFCEFGFGFGTEFEFGFVHNTFEDDSDDDNGLYIFGRDDALIG